jgi:hypothetical protein
MPPESGGARLSPPMMSKASVRYRKEIPRYQNRGRSQTLLGEPASNGCAVLWVGRRVPPTWQGVPPSAIREACWKRQHGSMPSTV